MKKIGLMICAAMLTGGVFAAGNFVQDSGVVTYSNTSTALESGQLVDLGDRYGVCLVDIASNGTGAVATKGIYSLQRYDTNAIANGAAVYYSTASNVTGTAAADKYVGQCVEAVTVTTALTNSAGDYVKFVKVDINVPQRQCIIGTDIQAWDTDLDTLALKNGTSLTNIPATALRAGTVLPAVDGSAITNVTATVTLQTTTGYDATGAAITNSAGGTIAIVTNATVVINP